MKGKINTIIVKRRERGEGERGRGRGRWEMGDGDGRWERRGGFSCKFLTSLLANLSLSHPTSSLIIVMAPNKPSPQNREVIYFYLAHDEYGYFSNFSRHSIFLKGKRWPTSEHYFQVCCISYSFPISFSLFLSLLSLTSPIPLLLSPPRSYHLSLHLVHIPHLSLIVSLISPSYISSLFINLCLSYPVNISM